MSIQSQASRRPCPGLNSVDAVSRWVINNADDETTAEIYCQHCANRLGIVGTVVHRSGGVCYGHMKLNKADNGLFNISFWEPDVLKFHDTQQDGGIYYVYLPPYARVRMLLTSRNPNKQSFRYELAVCKQGMNADTDSETWIGESKVHILKSSFVYNANKMLQLNYVDSQNADWRHIDDADRLEHHILNPGDQLTVKLHIYDIVPHDFARDSQRFIGNFEFKSSRKTIAPKGTSLYIRDTYNANAYVGMPKDDYIAFTKKPIEMKFVFLTDSSLPPESDSDLFMKSIIDRKIAKASADLARIRADNVCTTEQLAKMRQITAQRAELDSLLSEQIEQLSSTRR